MSLRVSTVSSDIFLHDLGTTIVHPTASRDLTLEFTSIDLRKSADLTEAIHSGVLIADDGTYVIHADDYDPDEVLIQQLGYRDDTLYISEAELASKGDIYVKPGVFPLPLNSTAQTSKNMYCPSGRWITWQVSPNDRVVITGCPAAGTYTVKQISDQQNLVVNEPIVDSTGGYISIFNPNAPTRIGVDDSGFSHAHGTTLQEILASIDFQFNTTSGINVGTHRTLDQLVHEISETCYEEVTYSGVHPTSDTVWTNSGKTTKIREEQYTWSGSHVNTLTQIQYNAAGVVVETMVETYTYAGSKVISVERSLT